MSKRETDVTRRGVVVGGVAACCVGVSACGGGNDDKDAKPIDFTMDAAQVPVGAGFIDKAHSVVITQVKKGEYKAFSSICTHERCQVGSVSEGEIICPCHNSHFSASTGEVTAPPADRPLAAKKVVVEGTKLHITG